MAKICKLLLFIPGFNGKKFSFGLDGHVKITTLVNVVSHLLFDFRELISNLLKVCRVNICSVVLHLKLVVLSDELRRHLLYVQALFTKLFESILLLAEELAFVLDLQLVD